MRAPNLLILSLLVACSATAEPVTFDNPPWIGEWSTRGCPFGEPTGQCATTLCEWSFRSAGIRVTSQPHRGLHAVLEHCAPLEFIPPESPAATPRWGSQKDQGGNVQGLCKDGPGQTCNMVYSGTDPRILGFETRSFALSLTETIFVSTDSAVFVDTAGPERGPGFTLYWQIDPIEVALGSRKGDLCARLGLSDGSAIESCIRASVYRAEDQGPRAVGRGEARLITVTFDGVTLLVQACAPSQTQLGYSCSDDYGGVKNPCWWTPTSTNPALDQRVELPPHTWPIAGPYPLSVGLAGETAQEGTAWGGLMGEMILLAGPQPDDGMPFFEGGPLSSDQECYLLDAFRGLI